MIKKNKALEQLDDAKRAHMKFVNRAKSITEGGPKVRDPHPLESSCCQFGVWLNTDGINMLNSLEMDNVSHIQSLHNQLHEKYNSIYEIYFGSSEGIVYDSKVTLVKNTISKNDETIAKEYMSQLRELSYALLGELEKVEKHINEL